MAASPEPAPIATSSRIVSAAEVPISGSIAPCKPGPPYTLTAAEVYAPIAMNPAWPIENSPVKPLIRFRLTARITLMPISTSTW